MVARKIRIEKDVLESLTQRGLSTRQIAKSLGRGQTSIRYWLKLHGIRSLHQGFGAKGPGPYKCCECGTTNPEDFYGHKKRICGKCHNQYTLATGKEKKARARAYLGDKCVSCGFNKYPSALDIHHRDQSVKDEKFHGMRGWSWERIERELQGCVLLCRNCHGAYHSGELEIDFTGM